MSRVAEMSLGGASASAPAPAPTAPTSGPWLEPVLDRHAVLVSGVLVVASATWAATGGPGNLVTTVLLAVLVATLGLPHGSFDMEVGRRLFQPRHGSWWWPRFVGLYLVATAAVLLWWRLHPATALGSLLVLGILHFGDEDLGPESEGIRPLRRLARAIGRGSIAVLTPVAAWPNEVAGIFAVLLGVGVAGGEAGGEAGPAFWLIDPAVLRLVGLIGLALAVPAILDAVVTSRRGRGRLPLVEPVVVLLAGVLLPPVAFFTLYFCLVHAVRHSLRSAAGNVPDRFAGAIADFARVTWPATAVTIVGGVVAGGWLVSGAEVPPVQATLSVVFIGLHALTVPHVLLALLERRAARPGVRS